MKFRLDEPLYDDLTKTSLEAIGQRQPEDSKFSKVVCQLLMIPEDKINPDIKVKRYAVLTKFFSHMNQGKELIDLSLDEISTIKTVIDTYSPPLAHGRLMHILNTPVEKADVPKGKGGNKPESGQSPGSGGSEGSGK